MACVDVVDLLGSCDKPLYPSSLSIPSAACCGSSSWCLLSFAFCGLSPCLSDFGPHLPFYFIFLPSYWKSVCSSCSSSLSKQAAIDVDHLHTSIRDSASDSSPNPREDVIRVGPPRSSSPATWGAASASAASVSPDISPSPSPVVCSSAGLCCQMFIVHVVPISPSFSICHPSGFPSLLFSLSCHLCFILVCFP